MNEKITETMAKIITLTNELNEEVTSFTGGKKIAGGRARKKTQEIKRTIQELRIAIQGKRLADKAK